MALDGGARKGGRVNMTHLWRLVQDWRDAQTFPVSQSALATKVGVSRSAMSQWKAGQARPGPDKLRALSQVTRIPYEQLLDAVIHDMGYLGDDYLLAARDADDDAEAEAQQEEA